MLYYIDSARRQRRPISITITITISITTTTTPTTTTTTTTTIISIINDTIYNCPSDPTPRRGRSQPSPRRGPLRRTSIYLSIYLFIYLSISLSIYIYIYIYVSVYLYIYLYTYYAHTTHTHRPLPRTAPRLVQDRQDGGEVLAVGRRLACIARSAPPIRDGMHATPDTRIG